MRIFVGYGYNERDEWIPDLVFPLLEAIGVDVVTGAEVYGRTLTDAVRREIAASDGVVGFTTKRQDAQGKLNGTHRWVTDELATAVAANKVYVLEVREVGLPDQLGIAADRARIRYDPAKRDRCLVEVAGAVGGWYRSRALDVYLEPDTFVARFRGKLGDHGFQCQYKVLSGSYEGEPTETRVRPIQGALAASVAGVPPGAMVQIEVSHGNERWTSDYEPVARTRLTMKQG